MYKLNFIIRIFISEEKLDRISTFEIQEKK